MRPLGPPLLILTFFLTTTAQLIHQLSDGQLQVPTSLAPPIAPQLAIPTTPPAPTALPAPIESATTLALPLPSSTSAAGVSPPPLTTLPAVLALVHR
ncbi:hypothetical protein JMJ35_006744 [Cladonia borealis]|uniref:Uncharacterized protein n=1 Tax=Cladonia borealis TaxID=184061 RepID=A0AA39QXR7_9LECA|nr:hypothetical protein JMJ35_006744 [Cladonia borealis]